jgi:hypothetical protein
MTLADLRKFSIRKQFRVRFRLESGLECVITEHGMAQVPALKTVPDFNLERELAAAREFLLEPVVPANQKSPPKPRSINRDEMEKLAIGAPAGAAAHDDHDDE